MMINISQPEGLCCWWFTLTVYQCIVLIWAVCAKCKVIIIPHLQTAITQ